MDKTAFKECGAWGLYTSIDLKDCDPKIVNSQRLIRQFVIDLCEFIDMKRYGEAQIVHFGQGDLGGYTALQLIETSSISIHFVDCNNNAYIDIFSCKEYNPEETAKFCKEYTKAKSMITHSLTRI